MSKEALARLGGAAIALVAFAGLAMQACMTYRQTGSALRTLWILFGFFTITTNLLVAVVFCAVAGGRTVLPLEKVMGGTVLSIVLVGVIYALLLRGLLELSGGSALANFLMHIATPLVVPAYWLLFVPKGRLTWRAPLLWCVYPLLYLAYALLRGRATGRYAYPFIDVPTIGWQQTGIHAAVIAALYILAGFGLVWLDGFLGQRRPIHRDT